MAKCKKCEKKGMFLKLSDGLCEDCLAGIRIRWENIQAAKNIYLEAKDRYNRATQAPFVAVFLTCWHNMSAKIQELQTYKNRIPAQDYSNFMLIQSHEGEFQWKLRDAIERAADSAIADIKGEYRNNKGGRLESFLEDVGFAQAVSDSDTLQFTVDSINRVCASMGVRTPSNILDSLLSGENGYRFQPDDFAEYEDVETELQSVDIMEGHNFEHWCANLLQDMGYHDVKVTPGSGDQGVDVLAQKDGIKYAVQCKCYSSDLGNTPVQEVLAGKKFYHCHVGAVMTNQYFTKGAKELAAETGVLLWDRNWIKSALEKCRHEGKESSTQ